MTAAAARRMRSRRFVAVRDTLGYALVFAACLAFEAAVLAWYWHTQGGVCV